MENSKRPLSVRLHGMDERIKKTMMMFFQGPCRGAAIVVDLEDADVDIFDGDSIESKNLLAQHILKKLIKPVIILSLYEIWQEGVFHVKKPIKTTDMLRILEQIQKLIGDRFKIETQIKKPSDVKIVAEEPQQRVKEPQTLDSKAIVVDPDERNKTAKHRTAMRFDEKGFEAYMGSISDIDVNESKSLIIACYNTKDFYQGYVESAFVICRAKSQILMLKSDWRSITLFPRTEEVWIDVDDLELKAFAGIQLSHKTITTEMPLIPVDPKTLNIRGNLDKFQNMDAFLWKLACWTSKGRYPNSIDYEQPIFLKNWPNFSRLLITPHALRIAALLIKGPRTMLNIAQALNIKPQYVFVFVSASHAVGLVGQARRAADTILQAQEILPSKSQGLLGRIMSKLRGN
jgi:hypothetical protein